MRNQSRIARRDGGFSLLEMMIVLVILLLVIGIVLHEINLTNRRYRSEGMKLQLTQGSRNFMRQVVHDLHNVGYPSQGMINPTLASPALASPAINDSRLAVGLVKASYDELWFEGDVTGSGTVDEVIYKLVPDSSTNSCPCTIQRSVIPKVTGNPLTGQSAPQYSTEIYDVINSGGANGQIAGTAAYTISGTSAPGGVTQTNDTLYAGYKTANLFTYYDADGNEITPTDITGSTISDIKTIRINVNVLAPYTDLRTGMRPAMSYSVAVRMPGE